MNEGEVNTPAKVTANSNSFWDNKDMSLAKQWKTIDWSAVNETVNRIQTRIAKAAISGNWELVRELQRMLVKSHHAKLLAVRKVTTEDGHKIAGVDGVLWEEPTHKMEAVLKLNKGKYKAKPLKRVEVHKGKGDGSTRPLEIPTMYDRAMQCLYALALDPVAESKADENSYGFRLCRNAKDAEEQIYTCMNAYNKAQWVLDADIKGFFDNINHDWLLENIQMDKGILKEFLKSGVVIKGKLYKTEKGVPQEGVIYPILANMTLDGLEKLLKNRYWKYDQRGIHRESWTPNYKHNIRKVNLIRYTDKFVVTGDSKETCEEIKDIINPFLRERGVKFSESKTKVVHIDEGFNFLGWHFRKYEGKLLVKPSKQSIAKFLEEIRNTIKNNAQIKQKDLILQLNREIREWRNYHKHVVARDVFESCDNEIFQALWKWALRRHKEKGKMWVKERYWHKLSNDNWVFYEEAEPLTKGNQRLIKLSNQRIIRYVKVDSHKNPYIDQEYFMDRNFKLGMKNLTGNFKEVWINQKGICPLCRKFLKISNNDNREIHHIVPKVWGGSDCVSNMIYVHEQCHEDYHGENPVRRDPIKENIIEYTPLRQNNQWKSLLKRVSS
jgi:RNA-directed DNA polymerase